MNDNLNLLITFVSTEDTMIKVAVCIEHGMNKEEWDEYKYFNEPDIQELIKNEMPMHVKSFCRTILAVETLFDIKGK